MPKFQGKGKKKGAAEPSPILVKKEFARLQDVKPGQVSIIGCKGACGSVWCGECYTRKGGSKRFSERLSQLDYKSTRQVVLTVDLKKFDGDPQKAYETLKERKAIAQFIHNLKRTEKIIIKDWVWNLEWHVDGTPHWHVFIETERGKKGKIGNEALLKHWDHGLVFESYIKSEKHWKRFVDYFSSHGYFHPKLGREGKNKQHQLELPEWAKKVLYRIRKSGSMVKKKDEDPEPQKERGAISSCSTNDTKEDYEATEKTYQEILKSCGQSTFCRIRKFGSSLITKKIQIPYKCFKDYHGTFLKGIGYQVIMDSVQYKLFKALYGFVYDEKADVIVYQ